MRKEKRDTTLKRLSPPQGRGGRSWLGTCKQTEEESKSQIVPWGVEESDVVVQHGKKKGKRSRDGGKSDWTLGLSVIDQTIRY